VMLMTECCSSLHMDVDGTIGRTAVVVGVATQGRGDCDQWVTEYVVLTSFDGYVWTIRGKFKGNNDRHTVLRRDFKIPVRANYVRIRIQAFHSHPSMRLVF